MTVHGAPDRTVPDARAEPPDLPTDPSWPAGTSPLETFIIVPQGASLLSMLWNGSSPSVRFVSSLPNQRGRAKVVRSGQLAATWCTKRQTVEVTSSQAKPVG